MTGDIEGLMPPMQVTRPGLAHPQQPAAPPSKGRQRTQCDTATPGGPPDQQPMPLGPWHLPGQQAAVVESQPAVAVESVERSSEEPTVCVQWRQIAWKSCHRSLHQHAAAHRPTGTGQHDDLPKVASVPVCPQRAGEAKGRRTRGAPHTSS